MDCGFTIHGLMRGNFPHFLCFHPHYGFCLLFSLILPIEFSFYFGFTFFSTPFSFQSQRIFRSLSVNKHPRTDAHTYGRRHTHAGTDAPRQTDRRTDRKTNRQTDRQTDRPSECEVSVTFSSNDREKKKTKKNEKEKKMKKKRRS